MMKIAKCYLGDYVMNHQDFYEEGLASKLIMLHPKSLSNIISNSKAKPLPIVPFV